MATLVNKVLTDVTWYLPNLTLSTAFTNKARIKRIRNINPAGAGYTSWTNGAPANTLTTLETGKSYVVESLGIVTSNASTFYTLDNGVPTNSNPAPPTITSLSASTVAVGDTFNVTGTNYVNVFAVAIGSVFLAPVSGSTTSTNVAAVVTSAVGVATGQPVRVITMAGGVSNALSVNVTAASTTKLAKPVINTPVSVTSTTATFTWALIPGADGYMFRLNGGTVYPLGNVGSYQATGLNPSTAVTGEIYATDSTNSKTSSDYSILVSATTLAANVKRKVLLIQRGDSRTRADGAAVAGGFRPASQYNAANAAQTAQMALANEGRQTSLEKAVDLYLTPQFGATHEFTPLVLGYPSQTSFWYGRNHLSTAYQGINFNDYDVTYEISEWFANDATQPDSTYTPTDSTAPAAIAAEVSRQMQVLKGMNPKARTIVNLPPNRDNYPQYANFKAARGQYIDLICRDSTLDEIADTLTQAVGLDNAPLTYSSNNNDPSITFYDDAGHLNGNGTTQQALPIAQAVVRLEGLTLSQGNGVRRAANPTATLAISPSSGANNVSRAATVTTAASYTLAEFYRVNSAGLTYAPTLLGTDSTAPFSLSITPSANGDYYTRLTKTDGTFVYTSPTTTATVTGSSIITRTLDFNTRQVNFTKQSDGTMLKTSGSDANHYAQATGDVYVPAGVPDDITLLFNMPPLNGGANGGGDFLVGFSSAVVPITGNEESATTINKVAFYANDLVARVFFVVNGQLGLQGTDINPRPAPGDQIRVQKKSDGYYFSNVTTGTQYPTVPANGGPNTVPASYLTTQHYVNAVGSTTGQSRVPVVTIMGTQFAPI